AAGIQDAAAPGARAASAEAVGHDNRGAGVGSLERGGRAGGAEPDDQHVTLIVPRDRVLAIDSQRGSDRRGGRIPAGHRRIIGSRSGVATCHSITMSVYSEGGPRNARPEGGWLPSMSLTP